MASPFTIRKELVLLGRRLYERGMIAGTDGNISVRLDDDRIMITPSGLAKGNLNPDDLVIVDQNGKHLQGSRTASSEYLMHTFVYRNRPDVQACVHSHPPYVTAFAVAGIHLAEDVLPEVVVSIGGMPLTDYAPPGTDAVPKSLEPFIESNNAFVLRNHGLLTVGHSLNEAYHRHEVVEHYARVVHLARQLGNLDSIPSDDFQRLEKMRDKLDQAWDEKQ
ncbi:MAG: class II aldolase/adducin family protein [candidate division Zixibacteria bacterium]|nr:class II aldolase/adducin family protein [candidate division Zixibacteria bacterium]